MKRIAIVGGGIAGLSAAYAITQRKKSGAPVELMLFEATSRLGGIVETERREGFVMECGPDSWVTEKPWARELAVELGLGDQIIPSNDKWRRTYLALEAGARSRTLTPLPDGMRMMVPTNWAAMLHSPILSWQAKLAYLREPQRAAELKAGAELKAVAGSVEDVSVRDFIGRHFGAEVADTLAAPLLAGVFGGDIASLSARAVIPAFVALEREHGSLILGLQKMLREKKTAPSVFATLRDGLGTLIDRMEEQIPVESIRRNTAVTALEREGEKWRVRTSGTSAHSTDEIFDEVVLATPAHVTGALLARLDGRIPALLPQEASSAIVVALAFAPEQARTMRIPRGFGFLVPQRKTAKVRRGEETVEAIAERALLACTFVDQKFSHRVPEGGVLLRGFFGGVEAPALLAESDATLVWLAAESLGKVLGRLPEPRCTVIRRWPHSLPQYAVGHLERMAELEQHVAAMPGLHLVGNAYSGVGLPDLIRAGGLTAFAAER